MGTKGQLGLLLFPATLDSEAFRSAWTEWLSERRDRRLRPYTARAQQLQLARLERMGPDAAIDAIRWSIAQGYSGIWPAPSATPSPTATKPGVWAIKTQLDTVAARLAELEANIPGDHCLPEDFLSDSELQELRQLRRRRRDLRAQLTASQDGQVSQ